MRSGQLREQITIQAPTTAADSIGSQVETFSDVVTVWASVVGTTGTEIQKDDGIEAATTYTVTMRYLNSVTITSANRLSWNGQTLEILSVVNDPKRTTLTMVCKLIT